jgi:RNA polymerase sigma-70 factor (ECF subfamily)
VTDADRSTQWWEVKGPSVLPRAAAAPDFADVFAGELAYVVRSLRRLGVQSRDVEDVAHDVFVVVHRELARFDADRAIRPWLFGIAFRVASDHKRLARNRLEIATGEPPERIDATTTAHERLEQAEDRALVLRALDAVELGRRAVLVMHDIDGHPVPAIARELGLPLNTTYSRLRLARDEFRAAVTRLRRERREP